MGKSTISMVIFNSYVSHYQNLVIASTVGPGGCLRCKPGLTTSVATKHWLYHVGNPFEISPTWWFQSQNSGCFYQLLVQIVIPYCCHPPFSRPSIFQVGKWVNPHVNQP